MNHIPGNEALDREIERGIRRPLTQDELDRSVSFLLRLAANSTHDEVQQAHRAARDFVGASSPAAGGAPAITALTDALRRAAPTDAERLDAFLRQIPPGQLDRLLEGLKEPLFPIQGATRFAPGFGSWSATDAVPLPQQIDPVFLEMQSLSPLLPRPLESFTPRLFDILHERLRMEDLLRQLPPQDQQDRRPSDTTS